MAMKEQQRAVYRSMQGKEIDMEKLRNQNELTVAVGNVKVNARGDELGPGGKIIKKREDVLKAAAGGVPSQNVRRATKNVADMDPEGNE
jgi:hypothetical protein